MTFTPIPFATRNWHTPLNAALTDLQDQIINVSFNIKEHGAVGDGAANDTSAIQSAISAATAAGGGVVYLPPGIYSSTTLDIPVNVRLVGANRRATQIRKRSAGVLINMSGPATDATGATHIRYSAIENMTLNGNSLSGSVLQCYYADNLAFRDVYFTSSTERLVDGVEFWDSRFYNCVFESSGGTNGAVLPAVHLRNASSATPATFGYSLDNVNQIVFHACRWENFHNGALRIEDGAVAGNNPNGIYVTDCKMETSQMQGGSHLLTDDTCRAIWIKGLYCFAGGFAGGFVTAQNIVTWSAQGSAMENVLISNGAVATVNSGIDLFSGANSRASLKNVIGQYTTAPTGAHIFYEASSTADFHIENCYGSTGTQSAGTIPIRWEGNQPLKQVAGVPVDASFTRTPLNGTLALNSTTSDFYARIAGAWKPVVRTGVATLIAGAATVAIAEVTATSRIQVTSQADGGTPGFLRVSARTAGVSFTITSSDVADTSTVAWLLTEP